MNYNGVELPTLPAYNKATYPYVVVYASLDVVDGSADLTNSESYFVLCCAEPVTVTNETDNELFLTSGAWAQYGMDVGAGETDWSFYRDSTTGGDGFNIERERLLWANHDVLDENGDIYLAGSKLVSYDKHSFLCGLIAGLTGKGVLGKREPVAYLYNGVRLPDIYSVYTPELQEQYPYVVISYFDVQMTGGVLYFRMLYALSEAEYGVNDAGDRVVSLANAFIKSAGAVDSSGNTLSWKAFDDPETAVGLALDSSLLWSNFDILNSDGTVFLAASDPIPVYE